MHFQFIEFLIPGSLIRRRAVATCPKYMRLRIDLHLSFPSFLHPWLLFSILERVSSTSKVMSDETVPPITGEPELLTRKHILFLVRSLKFLPTPYQAEDSNR